jgi:acyl-CoA synthetase (AMP-forming)/AMP-acid ligase II
VVAQASGSAGAQERRSAQSNIQHSEPVLPLDKPRNRNVEGSNIQNRSAWQDGHGGWLATGDIGYLDIDGDLWVVQRRSDLIISGGENIYPSEIEQVLRAHPAVADVAVVGVDSAEWGQQVGAVIVLRDPEASIEQILADSRPRLAGYKQPRVTRLVAELPRTASGKLDRLALMAMLRGQGEQG